MYPWAGVWGSGQPNTAKTRACDLIINNNKKHTSQFANTHMEQSSWHTSHHRSFHVSALLYSHEIICISIDWHICELHITIQGVKRWIPLWTSRFVLSIFQIDLPSYSMTKFGVFSSSRFESTIRISRELDAEVYMCWKRLCPPQIVCVVPANSSLMIAYTIHLLAWLPKLNSLLVSLPRKVMFTHPMSTGNNLHKTTINCLLYFLFIVATAVHLNHLYISAIAVW